MNWKTIEKDLEHNDNRLYIKQKELSSYIAVGNWNH